MIKGRGGFALILVLWLGAMRSAMSLMASGTVNAEFYYAAKAQKAFRRHEYLLGEAVCGIKKLGPGGMPAPYRVASAGGAEYGLEDISSRIDISYYPENILITARLIREEDLNAYLDWTDIDDLRRMNGAEAEYYSGRGLDYSPANSPVESLEELSLIKGFDAGEAASRRLKENAVCGGLPSVNIISEASLASYLSSSGFSKSRALAAAEKILLYRAEAWKNGKLIEAESEFEKLPGLTLPEVLHLKEHLGVKGNLDINGAPESVIEAVLTAELDYRDAVLLKNSIIDKRKKTRIEDFREVNAVLAGEGNARALLCLNRFFVFEPDSFRITVKKKGAPGTVFVDYEKAGNTGAYRIIGSGYKEAGKIG